MFLSVVISVTSIKKSKNISGITVKKIYISLIIIFIAASIHPLHAEIADFKKIIADYLSVNTVRASIIQHIYMENGTVEVFSGNYYAASKGLIRIDYLRPESQSVIVNESGLYWYYNNRRLLFLSEKKSQGSGSIPALMNLIQVENLKGVNVVSEGRKIYSIFKMADVYSITSGEKKSKMIIWTDPIVKTVIRKYVLDEKGREILKEEYSVHTLVNGVYIPSRIEFKGRSARGLVHTLTEYGNIEINSPVDRDLFKFRITPDMKVRKIDVN